MSVTVTPNDGTLAGTSVGDSAVVQAALPATPSGVVALVSPTSIELDWANNPPTDLAGYNVYRERSCRWNIREAEQRATHHERVLRYGRAGRLPELYHHSGEHECARIDACLHLGDEEDRLQGRGDGVAEGCRRPIRWAHRQHPAG